MAAVSVVMAGSGEPVLVIIGGAGALFFGLCTAMWFYEAVQHTPRIIICDRGIEDRRGGFGLIQWEDIQAVWVQSMRGQSFLCVAVNDPERYLSRLSWYRRFLARANESLGFSAITLNFAGLSCGVEEAMAFIRSHHELWTDELEVR
jgi:hypothetical protein